jgi:hypothetical protein
MWLGAGVAALVIAGAWWMTAMPGRSRAVPPGPLDGEEEQIRRRALAHVRVLAGEIGERNMFLPHRLAAAARYLEQTLAELGYTVASQELVAAGHTVRNLEVERPGRSRPGEIIVVGAHYDSVLGSPGANDNATGAAAALEIARLLRREDLDRTVRCVFFVNEEPPFFLGEAMGSRAYARRARQRRERIAGMFSLETLGYYSDLPGSQSYPFPFGLLYPRTGNFVGFVGNLRSRGLVRQAVGAFRRRAAFPSEGVAAPGWITGIGWSDHRAFWEQGYRAVMVTDTALFRYRAYHTADDTPDKVRYDLLARVVGGLYRTIVDLSGLKQGGLSRSATGRTGRY